ncbi:MAG: precorrin-6y C5,15-methyltransferase (decarboxylating) subunit CbiE [spirochete symbiont of Stewartia floridana]|nr:MAG: precorrin-6y C5,15-methyltransferase (decarboxylating) subunit CbiE [spirochete symbiont of Stewartia floridana]
MKKFKIVGMGPGGRDYIIPAALQAIHEAQILIGAPRHLNAAAQYSQGEDKKTFTYKANLDALISFIRANRDRRIALLVSGDPGFHSLLGHVVRNFQAEEYSVIPGISSFQTAMARLGVPWQEDLTISCHGKPFREIRHRVLKTLKEGRRVILLTDSKNSPRIIAAELLDLDIGDRRVWLGVSLTLPDEEMAETTLQALAWGENAEESPRLCVMVVQ